MENFACLFKGTTVFFSFKHTYLHHFSWRQYQYPNVNTIQSKHIGKLVTYPPPPRNPSNSVVIIMQFPLLSLPWMTASCSARAQPCHGYPILHWLSHWKPEFKNICKLWQVQLAQRLCLSSSFVVYCILRFISHSNAPIRPLCGSWPLLCTCVSDHNAPPSHRERCWWW